MRGSRATILFVQRCRFLRSLHPSIPHYGCYYKSDLSHQRTLLYSFIQTGSDLQSPGSAPRLQDGESGSGGGGFTNLKRNLQQRQRGGLGSSGSPTPSVGPEGSTSSQTRGLKRLTRKLSFRQRQAQANLQARFGLCSFGCSLSGTSISKSDSIFRRCGGLSLRGFARANLVHRGSRWG